jgi:hypothetical protein
MLQGSVLQGSVLQGSVLQGSDRGLDDGCANDHNVLIDPRRLRLAKAAALVRIEALPCAMSRFKEGLKEGLGKTP